jgi:N-acetyl-anhydromuramyl-L-alanine amidase AmpD
MRKIDSIIIHCTDSTFGTERKVRSWHVDGNGWSDIGYHFLILNSRISTNFKIEALNGCIELGRDIKKSGAHCKGYNTRSIGICLVGKDKFTKEQIFSLIELITDLMRIYKIKLDNVLGHYETPKAGGKTCPNLDCWILREMLRAYQSQDPHWFDIVDQLGKFY